MKRIFYLCMTFFISITLIGCSTPTPHQELIEKFGDHEEEINALTNEEAEEYLNFANENTEYSFVDIQEQIFLNDTNTPSIFKSVVEEIKEASKTAKIDWDIKNFNLKSKEDVKSAFYDLYIDGNDTNIDLSLMYDTTTGEVIGIGYISDGSIQVEDPYYFIATCSVLMRGIDPSISAEDALDIISDSYSSPVLRNNYYYSMTIDDHVEFIAVPVGK